MTKVVCLHVATGGDDRNTGTEDFPFASFGRAREAVRTLSPNDGQAVSVTVHEGTYYLAKPLEFQPEDSGTPLAPVHWEAAAGERVTLSAGQKLVCNWHPYRDSILKCELPANSPRYFDQLFINGKRQTRARWPKRDDSSPKDFSGYVRAVSAVPDTLPDPQPGPDDDMTFSCGAPRGVVFDAATFTKKPWRTPDEAVIHIFQAYHWGNLQWRIKRVDPDTRVIWFGEGGQQIGAKYLDKPCEVNGDSWFYIDNVFEELDTPGEWYLDRAGRTLYFMPPPGTDMDTALVEVPVLKQVLRISGDRHRPVRNLSFTGFRFAHTTATYLEPYAVPSRSDWSIHRGGAVFIEGTRDCSVDSCFFDAVGGNAVFVSNYNRNATISRCLFIQAGDSAICFVGSFEDTVGTQRSFPYECRAENNLIRDCGVFGKQIAGVYISRAKRITAAHNDIARMPRAGICIGDGTWGGHVIEHNLIRDTCRETGDHGPFNAWGRDAFWCLVQSHEAYTPGRSHEAGQVKMDAMEPVVVRHNRFEESAGWGLDLDDGASNYEIYNNLCVGISVKLREGAYRTVYNNIWVNGANSPCFHVGNEYNHDRYFRNITVMSTGSMKAENDLNFSMSKGFGEVYTLIAPPVHGPWLEEVDYNCLWSDLGQFVARVRDRDEGEERGERKRRKLSLPEWQVLGYDLHSVFADPLFVDPARGDYRVRPESPALKLGFVNFDMDGFGLSEDFPQVWAKKANNTGDANYSSDTSASGGIR